MEYSSVKLLLGGGVVAVVIGCSGTPIESSDGSGATSAEADALHFRARREPPGRGHGHGAPCFPGHGGSSGAAGAGGSSSGGTGGRPGTGGTNGTLPACEGQEVTPSTPLISGTTAGVADLSSLFAFAAPALTAPTVTQTLANDGSLVSVHAEGTPGTASDDSVGWFGFGYSLLGCVDVSAYTGVAFTVTGDLGTCRLLFNPLTSENLSSEWPRGSCTTGNCYGPFSAPVALGDNVVHFADLQPGSSIPAFDPKALVDLQWQFQVPVDGISEPCRVEVNVSNIRFVTD